ncbi:MAG: hypothetical protein ING02_00040, partial [Roseomonas sp.]|nr:hypothetical protein [Roseomonas sp.]
LLRGPDEGGYRHYRDKIEADPTCRRRLIDEMAGSSEARRQDEEIHILWAEAGAPAALDISPEALVAALREKLGALNAGELAELEEPLAECLKALRKALKQRA